MVDEIDSLSRPLLSSAVLTSLGTVPVCVAVVHDVDLVFVVVAGSDVFVVVVRIVDVVVGGTQR